MFLRGSVSLARTLPEKINKMFLPKKLGFIDMLRTVNIKETVEFMLLNMSDV